MLARFVVNSHVRHHPNAPKDDDDMQQVCWKNHQEIHTYLPSPIQKITTGVQALKTTEPSLKFADFNS